jgi:hypothetical protein
MMCEVDLGLAVVRMPVLTASVLCTLLPYNIRDL